MLQLHDITPYLSAAVIDCATHYPNLVLADALQQHIHGLVLHDYQCVADTGDVVLTGVYEGAEFEGVVNLGDTVEPARQFIQVDLETLHTLPGNMILSLGACCYDVNYIRCNTFHMHVTLDDQLQLGMLPSESTLLWWLSKGDELRADQVRADRIPLPQVLDNFNQWAYGFDDPIFLSYGANFDLPWLDIAAHRTGTVLPWHGKRGYGVKCWRTLCDEHAQHVTWPPKSDQLHNALADSIMQARMHQQLLRKGLADFPIGD